MSWLLRILNPIVWRAPGRASRKYFSFALAEQSSMVDLMEAAHLTTSTERAALYLRHANDEARHAKVFAARSAELRLEAGLESFGSPRADTEALFSRLGEQAFLAFVHIGETRGLLQFDCYLRYFERIGAASDRAIFSGIRVDESRHASYTYRLLLSLCGDAGGATRAIRRARRWRLWRAWRRAGRGLSAMLYSALMIVLYVAMSPLALAVKLLKPATRGWRETK